MAKAIVQLDAERIQRKIPLDAFEARLRRIEGLVEKLVITTVGAKRVAAVDDSLPLEDVLEKFERA